MAAAPSGWGGTTLWAAVGALGGFGILGAMTIGYLAIPAAGLVAVALARLRVAAPRAIGAGLLAGVAVPVCYVALLNWRGPGWICSQSLDAIPCPDTINPWPWFAAGTILLVAAVGLRLAPARGSPDEDQCHRNSSLP